MPHILIVGQKFSTLTDYLTLNGYTYTLIQDVLKTKFPDKKFKNRVVADFSSKESLLSSLDRLKTKPDAVMVTYENYVLPAAWIAKHLGLPGLPTDVAYACTDKYTMRSLFNKAPEKISPEFAEVTSESDVLTFAHAHHFPLILKPANLAKSLLVTKSSNLDELLMNYHKSIDLIEGIYKKYAPNRKPKMIIEDFLEGSIHSVDAFVDIHGKPQVLTQVVDYQTGYDIGYDDNFHYSRVLPSKLSVDDQDALRHCAEVGIKALGIKSSAAHVEIILTPSGPRIVEIGARNGGYRDRMHSLANGIDITGNALLVALGHEPNIQTTKNDSCAVLELFAKVPGTITEIVNEAALKELPSLHYYSRKSKNGQLTGKAADGYKAVAIIILHNSDIEQFERDVSFINNSVHVETELT